MPVDFNFWFTLLLLVLMSVALVKEWFDVSIVFFGVLLLLVIAGVVEVNKAFNGFSNVGVISIALLFIVAGALQSTGVVDELTNFIYGSKPTTVRRKIFRIMFPVTALSAFMNNTPIVAILIPSIKSWAVKNNLSPSKFLMPLSFAAILGGMCTLIGTSTNLIVHGLLIENGYAGFSFFELTPIGLPVALFGILFVGILGAKLLPERKEPMIELGESTREYVIELKVTEEYKNINKSIEDAGLRHLKGLFLFQIERNGKTITAVGPDEKIQLNDRLFFTGIPQTILELQKTPGLQLIKDSSFDLKRYDADQIKTFEAVVSHSSPLVGKTVRESSFRTNYNAVIIAIHRNGERIKKKIGDIVLKPGDTLLLLAPKKFMRQWYNSKDFYLISNTSEVFSKPRRQMIISVVVLLFMVLFVVLKIMPLISAAGLAAIILILTKSISSKAAKDLIDFKVLIVIGSAFGIAQAINNSGLAEFFAQQLLRLEDVFGIIGVLAGVYFLTSAYNTIITSNATSALIFPVALSTAVDIGANVHPFALTVAIASAASFASPISYQTNLMVYGPGGYRFKDYIKIGLPLQILVGFLSITLIYWLYF